MPLTPGSDFEAPAESARRLRQAYLHCLNEHPPVVEDLGRLFAALERLPQAPLPLVWTGELASADTGHARACRRAVADAGARVQALAERLRRLRGLLPENTPHADAGPWTRPAAAYALWEGRGWWRAVLWWAGEAWRALHQAAARRMVAGFCQRWPLPTRPTGAENDVWHSFQMWRLARPERRRARLIPGPWGALVPTPGTLMAVEEVERRKGNDLPEGPGFGAGAGAGAGGGVRIVTPIPVIVPNCPLPFWWDPVYESRQALAERLEALMSDIKESVLAQAEALEAQVKAAGWKEPPRRSPDLPLRAERLFRRAVLRQSWRQIAIATGGADLHLVRRQVLADATTLGIPLPTRTRTPARPTPRRDR
jgi:hypothetical protein